MDMLALGRHFIDRNNFARLQRPMAGRKDGVPFGFDEPCDDVVLSCLFRLLSCDDVGIDAGKVKGLVLLVLAVSVTKQTTVQCSFEVSCHQRKLPRSYESRKYPSAAIRRSWSNRKSARPRLG